MCAAYRMCNPGDQQVGMDCPAERECYTLSLSCGSGQYNTTTCVLPVGVHCDDPLLCNPGDTPMTLDDLHGGSCDGYPSPCYQINLCAQVVQCRYGADAGVDAGAPHAPDTRGLPDTAYEVSQPDLASVLPTCHPLLQDCGNKTLACYPGALGVGNCTAPTGTGGELAYCVESSDCAPGYYCGNGLTASNVCLLLCDMVNPHCAKNSPCVQVPGFKDDTGYCLE